MKEPVICLGARGGYGYSIKIHGKSSHAATPENGINAVDEAGKLIVELSKTISICDEKTWTFKSLCNWNRRWRSRLFSS